MMIRSRTPSCSAGGIAGSTISSVVTAGPGLGKSLTRGTTRIVGAPFPWPRPAARPEPASGEEDGDLAQPAALTVIPERSAEKPSAVFTRPVIQTSTYRVVTGLSK